MSRGRLSLFLLTCVAMIAGAAAPVSSQTPSRITVFEGARLITGDGGLIENATFVVQNNQFTQVGRRGEVPVPAGATRIDLSGKTVMPTMVDLHGHFGFQNVPEGTMSKETFTRENLIDHMQRLAYHGVGAAVGIGDLVDRADGKADAPAGATCRCGYAKRWFQARRWCGPPAPAWLGRARAPRAIPHAPT